MADCFFHTGRPAVTRCKQCGRPLCSECRHITKEGIFCSDKCAETARVYMERLQEIEQQRASYRNSRRNILSRIIKIVIFIVILYVVYRFVIQRFIR